MDKTQVSADYIQPSHFTMIPFMAMDDLDPYELALYMRYVRIAFKYNKSTVGNKHLAEWTKMSVSKVKTTRASLAEKGYILVTERTLTGQTTLVTLKNKWGENYVRYSEGG